MNINFSKCKVITLSEKHIILEDEELETMGEFCFLDCIVPSMNDVSQCIALALAVFGKLRNGIFSSRNISTIVKARLCGDLILTIAIYGVEIWML